MVLVVVVEVVGEVGEDLVLDGHHAALGLGAPVAEVARVQLVARDLVLPVGEEDSTVEWACSDWLLFSGG